MAVKTILTGEDAEQFDAEADRQLNEIRKQHENVFFVTRSLGEIDGDAIEEVLYATASVPDSYEGNVVLLKLGHEEYKVDRLDLVKAVLSPYSFTQVDEVYDTILEQASELIEQNYQNQLAENLGIHDG